MARLVLTLKTNQTMTSPGITLDDQAALFRYGTACSNWRGVQKGGLTKARLSQSQLASRSRLASSKRSNIIDECHCSGKPTRERCLVSGVGFTIRNSGKRVTPIASFPCTSQSTTNSVIVYILYYSVYAPTLQTDPAEKDHRRPCSHGKQSEQSECMLLLTKYFVGQNTNTESKDVVSHIQVGKEYQFSAANKTFYVPRKKSLSTQSTVFMALLNSRQGWYAIIKLLVSCSYIYIWLYPAW